MSRSNPTIVTPNPATIWFEWDGSNGRIQYYDKTAKNPKKQDALGANIPIEGNFTFILLDELSVVNGFHEKSGSGIISNEVKDTKKETLFVRSFKGGKIAEGFYSEIRDKIVANGGYYAKNCYIAFKDDDGILKIASLKFAGSALNAWIEFVDKNRNADGSNEVYNKAVDILGYNEEKKGAIVFRTPKFKLFNVSEKTNAEALELDKKLQAYLKAYFERARTEQVAAPAANESEAAAPAATGAPAAEKPKHEPAEPESEDVPF